MEEHTIDALIDQYLLGTISPVDKARLEKLMADDPAVAGMVRESKQAFKAIQLERHRRLREKLRALDTQAFHEHRSISGRFTRVAIILAVFILTCSLLAVYFSPGCLARRHFIADPHTAHMGMTEEGWINAAEAFREHDFEKAIQMYVALSDVPDTILQSTAKWNILMVQLAVEGPNSQWQIALDSFSLEAPDPFVTKAKSLSGIIRSPLYTFCLNPLRHKFTPIKPRLI